MHFETNSSLSFWSVILKLYLVCRRNDWIRWPVVRIFLPFFFFFLWTVISMVIPKIAPGHKTETNGSIWRITFAKHGSHSRFTSVSLLWRQRLSGGGGGRAYSHTRAAGTDKDQPDLLHIIMELHGKEQSCCNSILGPPVQSVPRTQLGSINCPAGQPPDNVCYD